MGSFTDYVNRRAEERRSKSGGLVEYYLRSGRKFADTTPEMEFSEKLYTPLAEMTVMLDRYNEENVDRRFNMALLSKEDADLLSRQIGSYQQQLDGLKTNYYGNEQALQTIANASAAWSELANRVLDQRKKSVDKMQQYENFAEFRQSDNWHLDEKIARYAQQAQNSDNSNSWFKGSSLFSDGYDFGDVTRTALASGAEIGQEMMEGVGRGAEKFLDAAVAAGGAVYGAFGNEAAQLGARSYVEESLDWEKVGKGFVPYANDAHSIFGGKSDALANSMGEMLAKAATPGGMVLTGITAFGGEAENAFRQGASYSEAMGSAAISSAAEVLTEKLFGGSALKEKGLINTQAITKNMSAGLAKTLLDYGIDVFGEGAEEVLSEFASNLGSILYREEPPVQILFSKEAWQGYLDSFVSGMLMGGLSNVGKTVGSIANKTDYHTGLTAVQQKQFNQAYKDQIAGMRESGSKIDVKTRRQVYDATMRALKGGTLNVGSNQGNGTQAEHSNAPTQTGTDNPSPGAAPSAPPVVNTALAAVREGGTVTNSMATAIVDNPAAVSYLTEQTGMELPDTMSGKRNAVKQAVSKLTEGLTNTAQTAVNGAQTVAVSDGDSGAVGAQEGSEGASVGIGAQAVRFAKGNSGKLVVQTSDGSAVDVDQAEFGSEDEAVVYHTVAKLATNAPAANLMLSTYEGSDVPAMTFAKGVEEAFVYGSAGIPLEQAMERGSFISELKDYQVRTAYKLGQMEGGKQTAREQATVRRNKGAKAADTSEGKVHFDGDRSKLNKTQRASLDAMEMLAKSLGVQIYVFESEVGVDGKHKGANGWYDPGDGSIHIDLYAGADGKGVMLFTMAHELTHFIRQWSPAKFKVLANFLIKQYGEKGVSVQELVENQQEKAKRNGRELTFEEAYEEVVADSMETMLTDGNVIQWMAELKQQDKGLWDKIRDWFKDLAGKLRAAVDAYKGVTPDSTEGKLVADMKDAIGILESLYQDALVDASENYNAAGAQKNTAHKGGVKYSLNQNAKTELHKALYDKNYRDEVLLRDETPAIMLAQKGVRNLPMTMNASHIRENVFTEAEALKLGLRVNDSIHYHGLGENFFLQIIDGLDNVKEAYRGTKQADDPARRENYFLLVSEFTGKNGNVVNVPVYIDEHARYNRVFIDTNKISTVFGRDNFREYIRRQLQQKNLVRIKNRNITASESSALIAEVYSNDVSKGSIRNPDGIVNKKLSDRDTATYAEIEEERQKLFQRERDLLDRKREAENNSELLQAMDDYTVLFDEARSLFSKRKNGVATQTDLDRIAEIKALREERLERVKELQDSLGLAAMEKEMYDIRAEKEALRIASDEAWIREGAEKENRAIEKAGVPAAEYFRKKALNVFRTTTNFNEAGYLLPDGKMLNFSGGERNHRYRDHREIGEIYEATQGAAALNRFLSDGNIRIMAESPGVDLPSGVEPTREQYDAMRRFINTNGTRDRKFFVDFSGEDGRRVGNYAYEGRVNAERVINDIRYFYENGSVREQSLVAQFHNSQRDVGRREAVMQVLEQENAKLKEDVSYLKELVKIQRTVTNGTKVTKASVESAAGYLKKAAGAKGNTAELAAVLKPFYEHIASEKELTWEGVKEQAQPAVEWLRDHVEIKKERSEYAQDILKQLRGSRIYLDESQMAEAAHRFGSYNDYRKSLFGTLTLSKDANTSLDSLWQELSAMYPDVFDGDTTSTDMPSALADAIHRLRNADITTVEYARDRAFIEQELLQQVYDSYWRVSTMHTVADVKQRQINRLKGEHFQRMEKLKRHHREQVDKLKQGHKERLEKVRQEYRDRADAKIADIKQKYQESRSKSVESRKKTELRRKIRKTIRELSKLLEHGTKERNVKQGMQEFASKAIASAEILFADDASNEDLIRNGIGADMGVDEEKLVQQCVDLMKQIDGMSGYDTLQQREALERKLKSNLSALRPVLERERARINKIPVDAAFDGLAKAYKALEKSDHAYIRNAFDDATYQYLSSMGETLQGSIIKDMSTEQLETLHKAYTLVLTKIRNANKGFVDGRAIDGTAKQLLREMESGTLPKSERGAIARNLANKIGWDYEKLYYALDRIGSETLTRLFNNLADSENIVMADVQEAKAFVLAMVEKYGYNDWKVNQKLDREFVDNTGKKFRLTLGEMMSLYAYSRRADAWDHFEVGGFVFSKTKLKDINPAATYKLTKEQCEGITGLLTKEQRSFAEEMQKFLSETMGGKGNEVSMQLYGIEMFGEENYFPIHTSGDFKAAADEARAKDAAGFASMSNAGFTKARQKGSVSPVMLDGFLEVWVDHVNEMSRYHGTVPALEDIRRVMNYSSYVFAESDSTSVKAAMKNRFGKEAVQYFDALYREANSGAVFDKLQKKQKWLLSRFRKNSVAYSLSVLVQQPASLSRAFAVIDKRHFNGFFHIPGLRGVGALPKGIGKMLSNHWTKAFSDNYNEMLKYAPGVTLAKEIGGFDTATGGSIRSYLLDTGKGLRSSFKTEPVAGKVKAVAELVDDNPVANLPNAADKLAWVAIWEACKHETVGLHPDLRPGSPEFLKIAGQRFTEVIRATQVYDSIFAKSPLLRSKNIGVQFAVSFMNEPNTTANMVEAAIRSFSKGERVKGSKLATAALRSVVFACVTKSIVYALRDDDEEETYLEKYIEAFTGSLLSDITIFNYIPFSRDIWSAAQGYDVERPDMVIIGDFMAIVGRLVKLHDTDTSEMSKAQLEEHEQKITEAWWKLLDSTAAIFGVPVKNVRREINAVLDHAEIAFRNSGKQSWRGIRDAIEQGIADASPVFAKPDVESYAEKFYEALINGDQNYVDRHAGGFKGKGSFYYFKAITSGSKGDASKVYRYLVQQKENSGMTTDEAEKSIKSGLKTQCRDHYEDGKISGDDAVELLVEYCGMDKEDANADVAYWQYKLDHPDADTYAQWFDIYFEKIEDSGIELDTFLEYRTQRSGLTKRGEILDVIDALPISDDQKDALYFAEGYAESTLHKAPWR